MEPAASPPPLLVFLHVPKTGGTSFRFALLEAYGSSAFLDTAPIRGRRCASGGAAKTVDTLDEDVHSAVNQVQSREDTAAAVASNLPFGIHRYVSRPCRYVTLLRDPVDRCISLLRFAYRSRPNSWLWRVFERHDRDIRRFTASDLGLDLVNDQVRMLCGTADMTIGKAHLDVAKQRLDEEFFAYGTTEAHSAFVAEVGGRLGWRPRPPVWHNAHSPELDVPLPSDARAVLKSSNVWDERLHRWASEQIARRGRG